MKMKELKEGMVVLAKPDRVCVEPNYYVEWFQEILEKNIELTVVSEAYPPRYDTCTVIAEKGMHKEIPFQLLEEELGRVIEKTYRRF